MTKQLVSVAILLSILSTLGLLWYLSFSSTLTPERVATTPEETFAEPTVTETEEARVAEYEDIVDDSVAQEVEPPPGSLETGTDTVVESDDEPEEPAKAEYAGTIIYEKLPGVKEVYRPEYLEWVEEVVGEDHQRDRIKFTNHNGSSYFVSDDLFLYELTATGVQEVMNLSHYTHFFSQPPDYEGGHVFFVGDTTFLFFILGEPEMYYSAILLIKGDISTGRSELLPASADRRREWGGFSNASIRRLSFDDHVYIYTRGGWPECSENIPSIPGGYARLRVNAKDYSFDYFKDFDASLPGSRVAWREQETLPSFSGDRDALLINQAVSPDRTLNARVVSHPLAQTLYRFECNVGKALGVLQIEDRNGAVETVDNYIEDSVDVIGWTADSKHVFYAVTDKSEARDRFSRETFQPSFYGVYSIESKTKQYAYSKEELVDMLNVIYGDKRFGLMNYYKTWYDLKDIDHTLYDGPVIPADYSGSPLTGVTNSYDHLSEWRVWRDDPW